MSTPPDHQLELAAEALRRQEVHVPDLAIIDRRLRKRRQRRVAWTVSLVVLCRDRSRFRQQSGPLR